MNLTVVPVNSRADINKFIKLPWEIYRGNKNWVPPLIRDVKETIGLNGTMPEKIEYGLFLALLDGKPVGRIFAGIDSGLNRVKNSDTGYFSMFECIDDYNVAARLFDAVISWMGKRNIDLIRGPVSPSGTESDEFKGLLIDCFDQPPVIMTSFNPAYYKGFFDRYGFSKELDVYAYLIDPEKIFVDDPAKVLKYAEKKYNFRVEPINLDNLEREIHDMKYILDLAVPDEWPDMTAPSVEDVREMAKKLLPVADPDLLIIARSGDEPVGFGITVPDYNQVLIHMNGRITPLSAVKFLWYKKRITCARFFIMFVIPSFRKKGVSHAIYYYTFMNALKKGYTRGEGSTIGETNSSMRKDIESLGAIRYKTYRIYKKQIRS